MAHLLVLEDDLDLGEELCDFFNLQGHCVQIVSSMAAFGALDLKTSRIDIAILDVSLPDGEGFVAAQALRQTSERMGIIFLSARSGLEDRIKGLRGGSDHYLVKPFSLIELGAVVDALLRRVGLDWHYDSLRKQLFSPEGASLSLNHFEQTLIALLAASEESEVSRQQLVTAMGYDWSSYDMRRLDTAVSRLRSRWKQQTKTSLPVRALYGMGYRFDHPIGRR